MQKTKDSLRKDKSREIRIPVQQEKSYVADNNRKDHEHITEK